MSTAETLYQCAQLTIPIAMAGMAHMGVVRWNVCPRLNRPINEAQFGKNKTWRGLMAMPVLGVGGLALSECFRISPATGLSLIEKIGLGYALGLAYAAFELPNSWMKRRLGIAPGKRSIQYPGLFALIDQTDSVLGCLFVYALFLKISWSVFFICLFLGPVVHLGINQLLYRLRWREEAF